jgi:hypothetical protein
MALTRNNVAYNLNESPHQLEVPYDDRETLIYVFSSEFYKTNFYNRFLDNREKISESLSKRFGFRVQNDLLSDLKLYTSIEKRGFLIIKGEEKIVCQENITLDGALLTMQS